VNNNKNLTKPLVFPIISCSRRTDIPAFLMDWVIEKINIGYVDVVNPFNKNQVTRVSLKPKDVNCWVWWSKNFDDWIKKYNSNESTFKQYKGHFFQFTINSPCELEPNLIISLEERFNQLEWLINEFGTLPINFRFDPIILFKNIGSDKIKSNLDKFNRIIEYVSAIGLKEMTFSFATIYPKVKKRMISRGKIPIEISLQKKKEIIERLKTTCLENDIKMKACCQPELLQVEGIEQAHCIDAYRIEKAIGINIKKIRDTGQREHCGCYKSKDIGGYTGIFRCKHNCDYCYASPAKQ